MAAWKCGWCGERSHMNPFGDGWLIPEDDLDTPLSALFTAFHCANCEALSVAVTDRHVVSDGPTRMSGMTEFWRGEEPVRVAPVWVEGQLYEDVPDHIGRAASEARKSQSISNHMSAILMARTVIEATAKAKGITDGNLFRKIDRLEEQDFIRNATREAAHEIRQFGNDMAHGDISVAVDEHDASDVLKIMDEILNEVFQGPERTARLRRAVQARKSITP